MPFYNKWCKKSYYLKFVKFKFILFCNLQNDGKYSIYMSVIVYNWKKNIHRKTSKQSVKIIQNSCKTKQNSMKKLIIQNSITGTADHYPLESQNSHILKSSTFLGDDLHHKILNTTNQLCNEMSHNKTNKKPQRC